MERTPSNARGMKIASEYALENGPRNERTMHNKMQITLERTSYVGGRLLR